MTVRSPGTDQIEGPDILDPDDETCPSRTGIDTVTFTGNVDDNDGTTGTDALDKDRRPGGPVEEQSDAAVDQGRGDRRIPPMLIIDDDQVSVRGDALL